MNESTLLISVHGNPPIPPDKRKSYQKDLAVRLILASILFERIAFYSIASQFDFTLRFDPKFNWTSSHSSTATYIFSGTSYLSTLFFAIISDAKLGRARTIFVGFILYSIGYTLMTVIAARTPPFFCRSTNKHMGIFDENCASWTLGTLIIIAVGAGAVKSNMAVFGAEQIEETQSAARYFDAYVVAVNIGAMIELWVIPWIQYNSTDSTSAYEIAAGTLGVAFLLFILGSPWYRNINLNETVISKCIPVLISACKTRHRQRSVRPITYEDEITSSARHALNGSENSVVQERLVTLERQPSSVFDYANVAYGGRFQDRIVNDVKSLRGAIIVFSLLIPYWLLYSQINTSFSSQGQSMKNISHNNLYIVAWMSLGDPIIVIIGTLILNLFVYKYINEQNRSSIIIAKLIIGMCCAVVAMCIAGGIEIKRQKKCESGSMSNLSICILLFQNIAIGFSQLFAMVASCEYAYFAASRSAQSLFMSLHFCAVGVASFIGAAYKALFSWIAHTYDQNYKNDHADFSFECPQDNKKIYWSFYTYFFILAGIQVFIIFIFILCQKKFNIIKLNPHQIENSQFRQN